MNVRRGAVACGVNGLLPAARNRKTSRRRRSHLGQISAAANQMRRATLMRLSWRV